jgi:hypothetical protein
MNMTHAEKKLREACDSFLDSLDTFNARLDVINDRVTQFNIEIKEEIDKLNEQTTGDR